MQVIIGATSSFVYQPIFSKSFPICLNLLHPQPSLFQNHPFGGFLHKQTIFLQVSQHFNRDLGRLQNGSKYHNVASQVPIVPNGTYCHNLVNFFSNLCESLHLDHEYQGFILTLFFLFSYFLNFSRRLAVEARAKTFFLPFSMLFSKWHYDFTQRQRVMTFFQISRRFFSITVSPLLTIAEYFTSGTIMAVCDGNITTVFIQRQETSLPALPTLPAPILN